MNQTSLQTSRRLSTVGVRVRWSLGEWVVLGDRYRVVAMACMGHVGPLPLGPAPMGGGRINPAAAKLPPPRPGRAPPTRWLTMHCVRR